MADGIPPSAVPAVPFPPPAPAHVPALLPAPAVALGPAPAWGSPPAPVAGPIPSTATAPVAAPVPAATSELRFSKRSACGGCRKASWAPGWLSARAVGRDKNWACGDAIEVAVGSARTSRLAVPWVPLPLSPPGTPGIGAPGTPEADLGTPGTEPPGAPGATPSRPGSGPWAEGMDCDLPWPCRGCLRLWVWLGPRLWLWRGRWLCL